MLSKIGLFQRDLALGHAHLLAGGLDAGTERVDGGTRRVDLCGSRVAHADELADAVEVDPRLVEAHLAFVDVSAGCLRLGFGQRHRGTLRLGVEPREHLAFADRHALLDVDLDHLARDLRRDGGAPPGRDVSGRIQDSRLRSCLTRRHSGGFHLDGPFAAEPPPCAAAGREEKHAQHEPHDPPAARLDVWFAFEAERCKVVLKV